MLRILNRIFQVCICLIMTSIWPQTALASSQGFTGDWHAVYVCADGYSGGTKPFLTQLNFSGGNISGANGGAWSSIIRAPSQTRRGRYDLKSHGAGQFQTAPVATGSDHVYFTGVSNIGRMRLVRAGSVGFGIGNERCTSIMVFDSEAKAKALFETLGPQVAPPVTQRSHAASCGSDVRALAESVAQSQSLRRSTRWAGPSGFLTNFDTTTARQYLFLNAMSPRAIRSSFGKLYSQWDGQDIQKFSAMALSRCPNNLRAYLTDQSFGTPYSSILRAASAGAPWQNLLIWEYVGPALDQYADIISAKITQAQTAQDLSAIAMDWNSIVDLLPADRLNQLSLQIAKRLPELEQADRVQAGVELVGLTKKAIAEFDANQRPLAKSLDDFAPLINLFRSGKTGRLYKASDPKAIALAHTELVPYLSDNAVSFFERDSLNIARSGDYETVMQWKEDQAVFLDLVAFSHGERLEALHAANIADIVAERRASEAKQAERAQLKKRRSELNIELAQLKYKRGNWNGWSESTKSTDSFFRVVRTDYNQGEEYQTTMSCHNIFDNAAIRIQSTILDRDTVNWKADNNNQVRIKIVTPSGQSIRRVDLELKVDTRSKTTYVNSFYFILTDVDDRRVTTKYRNPDVWATGPLARSLFLMAFSPVSLEKALQSSSYKFYGEIAENGVSDWVLLADLGNKSEGGASDFYQACDFSGQVTP